MLLLGVLVILQLFLAGVFLAEAALIWYMSEQK